MQEYRELKQYVEMYGLHCDGIEGDLNAILAYAEDNEIEEQLAWLITQLMQTKIRNLRRVLNTAQSEIPTIFYGNSNFCAPKKKDRTTPEEQDFLNKLTCKYLLGMELSEDDIKTAKETIPNRVRPFFLYHPFEEWLGAKYDIRYKEDEDVTKAWSKSTSLEEGEE